MAVIVKRFKIIAGGKEYVPGDVITCLTEKKEKTLVKEGYCEYPVVIAKVDSPDGQGPGSDSPPADPPKPDPLKGGPSKEDPEDGPATGHPLAGDE